MSAAAPETAATATPAAPRYAPRELTAEQATRDVDLLIRALETVHPGLYRYTAKPQIDAAFVQLKVAASAPVTELALHGHIARLLAAIHCDHTKAEMSEALRRASLNHFRSSQICLALGPACITDSGYWHLASTHHSARGNLNELADAASAYEIDTGVFIVQFDICYVRVAHNILGHF